MANPFEKLFSKGWKALRGELREDENMFRRDAQEAEKIGEGEAQFQLTMRADYVPKLEAQCRRLLNTRSIFISCAAADIAKLERAEEFFSGKDYDVEHGFRAPVSNGEYIPSEIARTISRNRFFLGIWTDIYGLKDKRSATSREKIKGNNWLPSLWMPHEFGMAKILNKPYRIICMPNSHLDVLDKLDMGTPRLMATDTTFETILQQAFEYFESYAAKRGET